MLDYGIESCSPAAAFATFLEITFWGLLDVRQIQSVVLVQRECKYT